MSDKYRGIYLLVGELFFEKERNHIEVICPCCGEKRSVRYTLLKNNNKDKLSSTICSKCSMQTEMIFYIDPEDPQSSFSILNGKKLYIDSEDVERVCHLRLQLTKDEEHVCVRLDKNHAIPLHRWLIDADKKNIKVVDHINNNGLDNRKKNLRAATQSENIKNSRVSKSNITGFKNIHIVCKRKQKWVCQFRKNKKVVSKRFEHFLDAYCYMYREYYSKSEFAYSVLQDATLNLRYADIQFDDISNGDGVGATLFTQFCPHKCESCHNPQTWSKDGGEHFTRDVFNRLMNYYEVTPFANRLTLSGGDPLANLTISNYVAAEFKRRYPEKELWIYTGYTLPELLKEKKYWAVLELADVIVDGRFEVSRRDITLQFRGSSNQIIWKKQNNEWVATT